MISLEMIIYQHIKYLIEMGDDLQTNYLIVIKISNIVILFELPYICY